MPSKAGDKNTYMRKLLKFTSITSREYRILRISYCKIELGKSKKNRFTKFLHHTASYVCYLLQKYKIKRSILYF